MALWSTLNCLMSDWCCLALPAECTTSFWLNYMETTWNCNLHRWLLKINRHYAELYQTSIPKGRYLPNLNICVPIHTYIHVSFNSETFLHLSFCAVSLNALNDSSEPYTVIPIVLALYRGSIFKLCVFLWCIFPSHGLQSRPLAHTSEHFENIRKGCKVAEMYYFFYRKLHSDCLRLGEAHRLEILTVFHVFHCVFFFSSLFLKRYSV